MKFNRKGNSFFAFLFQSLMQRLCSAMMNVCSGLLQTADWCAVRDRGHGTGPDRGLSGRRDQDRQWCVEVAGLGSQMCFHWPPCSVGPCIQGTSCVIMCGLAVTTFGELSRILGLMGTNTQTVFKYNLIKWYFHMFTNYHMSLHCMK